LEGWRKETKKEGGETRPDRDSKKGRACKKCKKGIGMIYKYYGEKRKRELRTLREKKGRGMHSSKTKGKKEGDRWSF